MGLIALDICTITEGALLLDISLDATTMERMMSSLCYHIDTIGQVLRGVAPLSQQPVQVSQLLAHAMSLVERDQDAAIAVMRRASALALRAPVSKKNLQAATPAGLAQWQADRIKRHIEQYYFHPFTLNEMAEVAHVSRTNFSTSFRATFGTSPTEYVSRFRAERAMKLMTDTDDPLSKIALDCGFANQSHLSRVFRRITMQTPNAWRRAARTKNSIGA